MVNPGGTGSNSTRYGMLSASSGGAMRRILTRALLIGTVGWFASFPSAAFEAAIQSYAGDWVGAGQDDHVEALDTAVEVVPDPWGFTLYAPRWIFSFSTADRSPLYAGEFRDAQ